jgi:F-type H+-transporting ATPase subunit gamma
MPSLKEVRNRIVSINSTQQITKAMKMVSAAKLRRAQDAIIQMRPYAQRLAGILNNLSTAVEDNVANPFAQERAPGRVLIIAITSDRGLAGAFNTNVMKGVLAQVQEQYPAQAAAGTVTIMPIGKKGMDAFSRRRFPVIGEFSTLFVGLNFAKGPYGRRVCHERLPQRHLRPGRHRVQRVPERGYPDREARTVFAHPAGPRAAAERQQD